MELEPIPVVTPAAVPLPLLPDTAHASPMPFLRAPVDAADMEEPPVLRTELAVEEPAEEPVPPEVFSGPHIVSGAGRAR